MFGIFVGGPLMWAGEQAGVSLWLTSTRKLGRTTRDNMMSPAYLRWARKRLKAVFIFSSRIHTYTSTFNLSFFSVSQSAPASCVSLSLNLSDSLSYLWKSALTSRCWLKSKQQSVWHAHPHARAPTHTHTHTHTHRHTDTHTFFPSMISDEFHLRSLLH